MEFYKRSVGYEEIGRTNMLVVTATTLYFPIFLKQDYEDIGIYTDTANPVYEIVSAQGLWNLSNNGVILESTLKTTGKVGIGGVSYAMGNNNSANNGGAADSSSQQARTTNASSSNGDSSITEKPITQFGASDGILSAVPNRSAGPATTEWTGPNGFSSTNPTITGLEAGSYVLKVTDNNNNISYTSYFLQQPQGLTLDLTTINSQVNATSGCNGSAGVTPQGGQLPYTYLWYSGSPTNTLGTSTGLTSLCAGHYTVQVVDGSGTIVSAVFDITEPIVLSGNVITTTNIDCQGGNTGNITVQGEGGIGYTGYLYELTGPATETNYTGIFNNLPVGTYNVKITDNVGSFINIPVTLTQPIFVTYTYNISSYGYVGFLTQVSCFNATDGTITVNPTGGNGSYLITINGGNTNFTTPAVNGPYMFNNLIAANYTISMVDTSGCPGPTTSIQLTRPPLLSNSFTKPPQTNGFDIPCNGGSVIISATSFYTTGTFVTGYPTIPTNFHKYYVNGTLQTQCTTSGCSYGPSNSSSLVLLTLSAGSNTIITVDKFGCSASTTVNTVQPDPLSILDIGIIDSTTGTTCTGCGINDCRQAIINIIGGVTPYSILWGDGGTLITSNSYCVGTVLTVTITDANGCVLGPQNITLTP